MKKIILFFAALAVSLAPAFAESEAVKTYTRQYEYKDFTSLSLSYSFQAELVFTDSYSVEVEVPDFIEPYLKVTCLGGKLRIGLEMLPRDIQRKLNKHPDRLKAWIHMPSLTSLTMSGATRLAASGTPAQTDSGLLSIELSGASKASIDAGFSSLDIDISGASKLNLTGGANLLEVECSGASKCRFKGDYAKLEGEISGSSDLTVEGNVENLEIDASGASKFDVTGETRIAVIELSGVSKGRLTIKDKMSYELSGVSTLKIKDLGATVRGEISRGSKIEYQQ